MSDHKPKRTKNVGRPRDEKSHQAIIQAALELASENGMIGTSIEAIARHAGVGKATIYRHWDSKEDLILEALCETHVEIPFIDTGDLRDDINKFIKEAFRIRSTELQFSKLIFRLCVEGEASPQFIQKLYDQLIKERLQHATEFIETAKQRGEIRSDIDPILGLLLVGGPCLYGAVFSAMAPGQFDILKIGDQVVDAIMEGIRVRSDLPPSQPTNPQ